MTDYSAIIMIVGLALFAMAWLPAVCKKIGISYAIVYVLIGVILYAALPRILPDPLPQHHKDAALHLAELVVIISLMGTGIRIDQAFTLKKWAAPIRLVLIAMILCIGACVVAGRSFLGLDLPSAMLLSAALAPTDPVLASDVQVGPPNETARSVTRFTLTAEAGLNDGMAFPFTWLSIALAVMASGRPDSLLHWAGIDVVYRIAAGIGIGFLMGKAVGYLVFRLSEKYRFLRARDGFLAVALTRLVYGMTEKLLGYGFIAVFVTAITLRHYEKGNDYHDELHSFTDQIEKLLVAVLLILFGGALVRGILASLSWQMIVFAIIFLLLIRPLAAWLSLYRTGIAAKEKLAISFLGIRGMGSIFYLAFAFHNFEYGTEDELWAVVSFTILCSILLHGLTAAPIMKFLQRNR